VIVNCRRLGTIKFEIKDENRNSLYGYKNEKDSIKIKPKFSKAEEFVNGYAKVEINLKNDKYDGYDLVGPCSYYFRAYFVYIERGIIGKNGKLIKAIFFLLVNTHPN
jgi:hypothetical protein